MKTIKYFTGIDIAEEDFTSSIFKRVNETIKTKEKIANNIEGFGDFVCWLQSNNVKVDNSVICMEATGVYGEQLCYFLHSKGYNVVVEAPHKVKRAFDTLTKNDRVDSKKIAEYAYRYFDQLKFWKPKDEILEKIKVLFTLREQLTSQLVANRNILKAFKKKIIQTSFANETLEEMIENLKEKINEIDTEIQKLIDTNSTFKQIIAMVDSIPGVGLLLATYMAVITNGFTTVPLYTKLSAFIGIAPHEHTSGKSVKWKSRSRGLGDPFIRKLLHLAARSLAQHNPYFRKYFLRKLNEGKPKRLIYNNIANKLLRMILAVIRTQNPYIPNYKSVNPLFLKSA